MRKKQNPLRFIEFFIGVMATHDRREEVLGDFIERCRLRHPGADGKLNARCLLEAMQLIPFFIMQRLRLVAWHPGLHQAVTLTLICGLIIMWEMMLVQKHAWPLTAELLNRAAAPGKTSYFIIYAALYMAGCTGIVGGFAWAVRRVDRMQKKNRPGVNSDTVYFSPLFLGLGLSIPLLLQIIMPQPLDSISMRAALLAMVWGSVFVLWKYVRADRGTVQSIE